MTKIVHPKTFCFIYIWSSKDCLPQATKEFSKRRVYRPFWLNIRRNASRGAIKLIVRIRGGRIQTRIGINWRFIQPERKIMQLIYPILKLLSTKSTVWFYYCTEIGSCSSLMQKSLVSVQTNQLEATRRLQFYSSYLVEEWYMQNTEQDI